MTKNKFVVNEQITALEVLLVESDGSTSKMLTRAALQKAKDCNMDLVQMNENPAVCKIFEVKKHIFSLKKKESSHKKSPTSKSIQINLFVASHDFNVKLQNAKRLANKGHLVKCNVTCKGRQHAHKHNVGSFIESIIENFSNGYVTTSKILPSGSSKFIAEVTIRAKNN